MKPLTKARPELQDAKRALDAMLRSGDLDELDRNWVDFLRHLERVWNKAYAQLNSSSRKFQGWTERGRMQKLRRQDPLVKYLRQARNADEHGIEELAMKTAAGAMTVSSRRPATILVQPATYVLVPVTSRGVVYPVPTSHLDKPLASTDPVLLATLGIAFYERFLDFAESTFVK